MTIKRRCKACGQSKPLTEFYADQLRYESTCKCKVCVKAGRKPREDVPEVERKQGSNPWESLGSEWSQRQPYDPYTASNRYGDLRHE